MEKTHSKEPRRSKLCNFWLFRQNEAFLLKNFIFSKKARNFQKAPKSPGLYWFIKPARKTGLFRKKPRAGLFSIRTLLVNRQIEMVTPPGGRRHKLAPRPQGGAKTPIFWSHISDVAISKNRLWKLKMIIQTNVSKNFSMGGHSGVWEGDIGYLG